MFPEIIHKQNSQSSLNFKVIFSHFPPNCIAIPSVASLCSLLMNSRMIRNILFTESMSRHAINVVFSCFFANSELFVFLVVHELKSSFLANNIIRTRIIKNHDISSTLINCFISFSLRFAIWFSVERKFLRSRRGSNREEEGELA